MARAGGNQTLAARLLGLTQSALSKRLKAYRS
jgi:DNA-binding protein Fis